MLTCRVATGPVTARQAPVHNPLAAALPAIVGRLASGGPRAQAGERAHSFPTGQQRRPTDLSEAHSFGFCTACPASLPANSTCCHACPMVPSELRAPLLRLGAFMHSEPCVASLKGPRRSAQGRHCAQPPWQSQPRQHADYRAPAAPRAWCRQLGAPWQPVIRPRGPRLRPKWRGLSRL